VVACVGLSAHYQNRADHDRAIEIAEQIVGLAGRTGSPLHRLTGHGLIAPPAFYTGDLARSLAESRSALRHYPRSGVSVFTSINDFGVAAHGFAAWSATLLGFPDEGLESASAGVELAEKLEHAFSIAMAYVFRAATHFIRREPVAARAWAQRAIELADELDFPLWRGLGIAVRGWADLDAPSGDGLSDVQEGLAIAGATGSQAGAPLLLSLLGEANLREGDFKSARSVLEGALALAIATDQPFVNEHLELLLGDVEAALDEPAAAEARYRRALDQSRRTGARLFELRAATRLVNLPPGQGGADSRADLADVYAWFHEGFDTPDLVAARVLLGLVS
jgi:adenylate cyclase